MCESIPIRSVAFSVSGVGCPSGAYTAPITLSITNGVTCTLTVQPPAATADTRSSFSRWADGTLSATRTIVASPGAVYTIVMTTEYRLMRLVSGAGSVSGSDAFYAAGSTVQLTATARRRVSVCRLERIGHWHGKSADRNHEWAQDGHGEFHPGPCRCV